MARIAGVNIPNHKHTEIGLTAIYGIGRSRRYGRQVMRIRSRVRGRMRFVQGVSRALSHSGELQTSGLVMWYTAMYLCVPSEATKRRALSTPGTWERFGRCSSSIQRA